MERKLNARRKLLLPSPAGWRLRGPDGAWSESPDLAATAVAAKPGEPFDIALPASSAMFERMRLPSTDADELSGMVRLQAEKTLPFPPEEITGTWLPIKQEGDETLLLAIAFHQPRLDETCAPFLEKEIYPDHLTLWAAHLAARCPAGENVLLLYREAGRPVLAGVENARLAWVDGLPSDDPADAAAELGARLLAAELDGVDTRFTRLFLAEDCSAFAPAIAAVLPIPRHPLPPFDPENLSGEPQLLPEAWGDAKKRAASRAKLRSRLALAGGVYLLFLLGLLGWLVKMQLGVDAIDRKLAAIRPQVEQIQSAQARWRSLAPAVDPSLGAVEIMHQIMLGLPDENVRVTAFDQAPDQIVIEGEAPSANLAIQFTENIKQNPELAAFAFEADSPTLLPNEHAKFRIYGKR